MSAPPAAVLPPSPRHGHDGIVPALIAAAALHAFVILGITFVMPRHGKETPPPETMQITLVQSHSDKAPKKADYLAQANQAGGGNVKQHVRPTSPFPNPTALQHQGDSPRTQLPRAPREQPQPKTPRVMSTPSESTFQARLQTELPRRQVPRRLDAAELVRQAREIAELSAEIGRQRQAFAKLPRERVISANTREYKFAAYMASWRSKVERIGNLNYPEEAIRRNLSGSLILDVALRANGHIASIKVLHSSGIKVLDDAAVRIVKLAAPFAPFPPAIRKEYDILHIVRTWQFQDNTFSRQ